MENRIYTSSYNIPTGAAPSTTSPTQYYDPNTMFLAHYRRTAEAAAAASSIRYSSDFDIAPPGVASRISTTNPWANAFPSAAAAVAAAATNAASAASLDLKRSSDALYHPSILSTIGQNEAWYTSNSLAKRPRYETGSALPIYPQRPGEKDCAHYMLTRTCKFGESCKFDHPIWVPAGGIPDWKEVPNIVPSETLPERPGEPDCPFFLKTQKCKFGTKCKFNHPNVPSENADVSGLPERPQEPPCAFYLKTGKCKYGAACKFHHPKDIQIQLSDDLSRNVEQTQTNSSVFDGAIGDTQSTMPLISPLSHNSKGLPVRPGEVDCPFYMKTGSCKFGASCRYNHPDMSAINPPVSALGPSVLASSTANLNIGAINPAASFYQAFDPSLSNPMSQVGVTGTIYPQRPGQIECDFYMKSGICKFGERCKYHHPIDRTTSLSKLPSNVKLTAAGLPRREGVEICPYYLKTATCKFGATCKFDHPPPGEVMEMAKSQGASTTNGGETETNENVPGSAPEQY